MRSEKTKGRASIAGGALIGLTEEKWQLTGNEADETRRERKAVMIQDCSTEQHLEGTKVERMVSTKKKVMVKQMKGNLSICNPNLHRDTELTLLSKKGQYCYSLFYLCRQQCAILESVFFLCN